MKKISFLLCVFLFVSNLYSLDYTIIKLKNLYGIVDNNLNVIVEPEYSLISIQPKGFICYDSDRGYCVYNSDFKKVFSSEKGKYLTRITDIDYRFQKNIRNYSVLDITTGKISEYNNKYHYNIQNPFCEGLSVILEGSHFIVMDEFGHKVIKDIEESGSFYSEGPRKDTILTPVFNEGVAVVRQTINEWNYKIA